MNRVTVLCFSLCLFAAGIARAGLTETTYSCAGTTTFHSTKATWAYASMELTNSTQAACYANYPVYSCSSTTSNQNGGVTNRSSTNPCPQPPSNAVFLREAGEYQPDGGFGHIEYYNYVGTWDGPWDPEICLGEQHFVGFDPYQYDLSNQTSNACLSDFNNLWYACNWTRNPPSLPPTQYQNCLSEIPDGASFLRMGSLFNSVEGTTDVKFYIGFTMGAKSDGKPAQCVGNPIDPLSGNKYEEEHDYSGVGPLPLSITRYYNSRSGEWLFSYEQKVLNPTATDKQLRRPDGKVWTFTSNGSGGYDAEPDAKLSLAENTGSSTARWQLTTEDDTVESYNADGYLTSIANRAGQSITVSYSSTGEIDEVTHYSGRSLTYSYDTNSRIIEILDPAGAGYDYSYDGQGRLTTVTYPDISTRQYHYENGSHPTKLTGITDENSDRYSTYSYGTYGDAVSTEHANGVNEYQITRNNDGTVTVTNPLGKDSTYTPTVLHGVAKTASIDGEATTLCAASNRLVTYDPNGFVDVRTDENGNETDYDYNSRGLLTTLTEAVGEVEERITTTTWHADFRVPTQIVKPGQTIDMTYDTSGRLLTRTITDTQTQSVPYTTTNNTRTWTYTYNTAGLVATIDGPRTDVSDITTFTYDANDELWKVTNALSQVETEIVSRNALGLPTAVKDINGVTTELAYDVRGRLTSRTVKSSQGDAITTFTYDDAGQLIEIELPDSSSLTYEYDAAHRLTAIENNLGERIEYTLDAAGNRTTEVIKNASSTIVKTQSRVFDELSRLRKDLGANSQSFDYDYDLGGNLTDLEDTLTRQTDQSFDALDRLIEVIDPDLNDADYAYDDRDNLTSVTDPKGITTTYIYDGMDNLIQESSPDAGTIEYVYDAAGNLTQKTDARGVVTNYTYDALNRVLTESFPSETVLNIAYTYDAGTHGKGQLTSFTDGSGSTTITYDDRGNVLSEVRTINSVAHTTSYAYDLADNLTKITYPNGRIVDYSRDALGRIAGITTKADSGSSSVNVATSVAYEAFGPLTSFTFGNSLVHSMDYDQDFRVTDIEAGSIQDKAYGYDTVNNITGITDGVTPADSQSFAYDDLDRLETDDGPYGDTDYVYDANGNRTSKVQVNGGTVTETTTIHSTSNRLNVSNGTTIIHDAGGNQLNAAGSQVFEYNARNRMDVFKIGTTLTAEYEQNAYGQRVLKTVYGASTDDIVFHFGLGGEILGTTTYLGGGGKLHVQYIWLDGKPVAQYSQAENGSGVITSTETVYLHTDHLDTPRLATGTSGTVKWRWDADAFGVGTQDTDPDNDSTDTYVNLRFPGQYQDSESGNHYNYFRDYDVATGRYVESDPIGLEGGLNRFTYVSASPVRYRDPEGLRIPSDIVVGCSGVGCTGVHTYEPDGLRCGGCEDPITITYTSGLPNAKLKPDVTKQYSLDCLISLGFGELAGTAAESAAERAAEHGLRAAGMRAAATAARILGSPPVTAYNLMNGMEGVFSQCECVQ